MRLEEIIEKEGELKVINGKIRNTHLGKEDHGIFTCWVHVDFGGSCQGFGGWAFDHYDKERKEKKPSIFGCAYIMNVLDVLEIDDWEDLEGNPIRVLKVDEFSSPILAIGHYLKDQWFYPKALAKKYETESKELLESKKLEKMMVKLCKLLLKEYIDSHAPKYRELGMNENTVILNSEAIPQISSKWIYDNLFYGSCKQSDPTLQQIKELFISTILLSVDGIKNNELNN